MEPSCASTECTQNLVIFRCQCFSLTSSSAVFAVVESTCSCLLGAALRRFLAARIEYPILRSFFHLFALRNNHV